MFRFKRHSRQDDEIGPSKGLIKWINKFFRFILYPFLHPLWFVTIITILFISIVALPSYYGIKFNQIPVWYQHNISIQLDKIFNYFHEKKQDIILPQLPVIQDSASHNINIIAVKSPSKKEELVDYEVSKDLNRKIFEQSKEVPVDVELSLKTQTSSDMSLDKVTFKQNPALGLVYLENPKQVSGIAKVLNANEITLDGEKMFFYGIYVDPYSARGLQAQQFLEKSINDKNIDCVIGAYTSDGVPTVICIYDKIGINHHLVNLNYSQNVSLQ